ncbi:hypothetical protein [Brassicibacter mesophilus]|uniref:hypothetical protein n=1 Tax=Brassicibacter mesophilus TaxID=745119 RepID=UPI003D1BCB9D
MLDTILIFIDKVIPNENFAIAAMSFGGYLTRGILHRKIQYVDGLMLIVPVIVPEGEKRDIDEVISNRPIN